MELWDWLIGYTVGAVSLAWTSYIMIYREAIDLLEEIVERKTVYSGFTGFIFWTIMATIMTPWVIFALLSNNNKSFITEFAVNLAERMTDEDDE